LSGEVRTPDAWTGAPYGLGKKCNTNLHNPEKNVHRRGIPATGGKGAVRPGRAGRQFLKGQQTVGVEKQEKVLAVRATPLK
jgi:hypothetical protein